LIENEDGSVTELDYEGPVDEINSILEKVDEMTNSETDD
jgi:hypothetical protein